MAKSNPEEQQERGGRSSAGVGEAGGGGSMEIRVWLQSPEGFSEEAASVPEKRFLSKVHSTHRGMEVWKTQDH